MSYQMRQEGFKPLQPEPSWRSALIMRRGQTPAEVAGWLFDNGSLTQRLRKASGGDFRVEFLEQQWARPLRCERVILGLDDRAVALIRQVRLWCNGRAVVYARTVMPRSSLVGRQRRLARLGGRPLGERLFRDRTMSRSVMEVAEITPEQDFYEWALGAGQESPQPLWGRRSLFTVSGRSLLVNELFLPPLPSTIKHKQG
jgi:chorismate--pyruvate lyase